MHIAVIDPGVRIPELDAFNRMSRRARIPLSYHLPALAGLDSLERASHDVAGVVIFGSAASVHDDLPWQSALRDWLAPRIERLPMLGLCYGHQLLAHMLGGEVGYVSPDRRKLTGRREVTLSADPLWGEARTVPLLVSHCETVRSLPGDCTVVGTSEAVEIDAFRHRTLPVWGFQPHPEATPAFAANNDVPVEGPDQLWALGHSLVDAFVDSVARSL